MTVDHTKIFQRRRSPLMAAGAVMLLSGCTATHVGDDWQCAVAQGVPCTSVAAADPAVQGADPAVRGANSAVRGTNSAITYDQATPAKSGGGDRSGRCKGFAGWNPLAILARLLYGDCADDGNAGAAESGPEVGEPAYEEAQTAIAADTVAPDGELRAPERIGRVWIAPYVDAEGVYREASWVRIVIAPADWKR